MELLIIGGMSIRKLSSQSIAIAGSKVQYKVVVVVSTKPEDYETILNKMSNEEGWTFDHVVEALSFVAFRK